MTFKKNNLNYRQAIKQNIKEINNQNELLKINTKMIVQFEHERVEIELASKQKDVELLHMNNQLKIKMKSSLVKELQKLKKSKSDINLGIQSIINKLKYQIEQEKKIDLLQENIDIISSDFYDRMKNRMKNLSSSELELLSFIKLKMSNKEIAIQKNTSQNTINVALHRLKAKCNFTSMNELRSFVEGF